jgi:ketosteroid isomerase-like protein
MSQENVEVAKAAYAAWNAGDMDAFRELCDPDIVMRPPERWPEPGPFVGREAVMRQWEQVRETWVADAVEPISDFIEAGDRVVVRQIWRGVGSRPRVEHRADECLHGAQGQDLLPRVLLGSRGGSRNPGDFGVGDVAGERRDRRPVFRGHRPR